MKRNFKISSHQNKMSRSNSHKRKEIATHPYKFYSFFHLEFTLKLKIFIVPPQQRRLDFFLFFILAYDLATQCPSMKSMRRHTMVCTLPNMHGSLSVPPSRPVSRNTSASPEDDSLSCASPQMSWSRNSLQEELFESVSLHRSHLKFLVFFLK